MSPAESPADRAAVSSALWARSVAVDLLALLLCRLLLSGFEIDGAKAYTLAVIGIELPTAVWWLTLRFWPLVMHSRASATVWVAGVVALTLVVPLVLATTVPGVLVAEWISSLEINGFWTYVAASAITAGLTIVFRQSRPLRFVSRYLKGFSSEEQPAKSDEADREFRRPRLEVGHAIRDVVLGWWYAHRTGIKWTLRALRVAALLVGYLTVGFWFGLVLALIVYLLPAAILWPLVRSFEKSRVPE